MSTTPTYSVPQESHVLLHDGILSNPLHMPFLPPEIKDAAKGVEFVGSSEPSIPINWRFAESISAIKGFQAAMLNVLLKKKYGVGYQKVVINTCVACSSILLRSQYPRGIIGPSNPLIPNGTFFLSFKFSAVYQTLTSKTFISKCSDHAQLFIMSVMLSVIDPLGAKIRLTDREKWYKFYPDGDKHHVLDGGYFGSVSTNIYKTKDGRFFHLHGESNFLILKI